MQTDLGLAKAPRCDLCHHAAMEPVGAVDTAFGKSTVARGLVDADAASLAKALDGMRESGVDSDGDGAKDLDELSWGGDPNQADVPEGGNEEPVTYGCSWVSDPGGRSSPGVVVGMLMALVVGRARGRARRSR